MYTDVLSEICLDAMGDRNDIGLRVLHRYVVFDAIVKKKRGTEITLYCNVDAQFDGWPGRKCCQERRDQLEERHEFLQGSEVHQRYYHVCSSGRTQLFDARTDRLFDYTDIWADLSLSNVFSTPFKATQCASSRAAFHQAPFNHTAFHSNLSFLGCFHFNCANCRFA